MNGIPRINSPGGSGLIPAKFFDHMITMKMFHFQTKSYGRHKAVDGYFSKFMDNFDKFMEVYQGINGKIKDTHIYSNVTMTNDEHYIDELNEFIQWLKRPDIACGEPGLTNIRDEMIADAQQLIYLLRDFTQ